MSDWRALATLLPSPIAVLDVGARAGVSSDWSVLGDGVLVYGFEPDPAECERLNREGDRGVRYVAIALGARAARAPFHVTSDPFCSSLLAPLERLARERPRLAGMRTSEVVTVQTRTIDEWASESGLERVDHLKLDVQGAELAVLEGAARAIATVRSVRLEVQFTQLYAGAPLFRDVDRFLDERGFELWRLGELSHCAVGQEADAVAIPEVLDYDSRRVEVLGGGGQLLWANAYYVRKEATRPALPMAWDDALRDACLAGAHGYGDLAALALKRAVDGAPGDLRSALAALAGAAARS